MRRINHGICKIVFIALTAAVVPMTDGTAEEKDADRGTMTIQILTVGFRIEGHTLAFRGEGKLFDVDGGLIKPDGLKETLSRPDLLNESNELIINLHIGHKRATIEELTSVLQTIHDSIPKRKTIVYIYLPIRKTVTEDKVRGK